MQSPNCPPRLTSSDHVRYHHHFVILLSQPRFLKKNRLIEKKGTTRQQTRSCLFLLGGGGGRRRLAAVAVVWVVGKVEPRNRAKLELRKGTVAVSDTLQVGCQIALGRVGTSSLDAGLNLGLGSRLFHLVLPPAPKADYKLKKRVKECEWASNLNKRDMTQLTARSLVCKQKASSKTEKRGQAQGRAQTSLGAGRVKHFCCKQETPSQQHQQQQHGTNSPIR